MLISQKQHEANCENAKNSTGPITGEGKANVRLNALKYGLRARQLLLPWDDPEEYKQLWEDLLSEWRPQTHTERLHLEQMATSQWMLARLTMGERRVYETELPLEKQLAMLRDISTLRVRNERSFAAAMRALQQLQQARRAESKTAAKRQPVEMPAPPPGPIPEPPPLAASAQTDSR